MLRRYYAKNPALCGPFDAVDDVDYHSRTLTTPSGYSSQVCFVTRFWHLELQYFILLCTTTTVIVQMITSTSGFCPRRLHRSPTRWECALPSSRMAVMMHRKILWKKKAWECSLGSMDTKPPAALLVACGCVRRKRLKIERIC